MTYSEFILRTASVERAARDHAIICKESGTVSCYSLKGRISGETITAEGRTWRELCDVLSRSTCWQLPPLKALVFSRQRGGRSYAIVQAFLTGSSIVDMRDYTPPMKERT